MTPTTTTTSEKKKKESYCVKTSEKKPHQSFTHSENSTSQPIYQPIHAWHPFVHAFNQLLYTLSPPQHSPNVSSSDSAAAADAAKADLPNLALSLVAPGVKTFRAFVRPIHGASVGGWEVGSVSVCSR